MTRITLALLLSVIPFSVYAQFDPYFTYNGVEYETRIDFSKVDGLPYWKIGEGDPPVSLNAAYKSGLQALNKTYGRHHNFRLFGATMNHFDKKNLGKNFSFWSIDFVQVRTEKEVEDATGPILMIRYIVLMDGTVIEPRKIPE